MNLTDLIAIAVILVIAAAAAGYIYREKKRGARCIGCPQAASCSAHSQEASPPGVYGSKGGSCCCHGDEK